MSRLISERIDALDDKQAIFQIKILLQSAKEATPALPAMSEAAVANELTTIAGHDPETLAQAAALLKNARTQPLPTKEAGALAKELLRIFAAAPGGEAILNSALDRVDQSADFGFITFPLICTFMWLTITGDLDLQLGGLRFRKKGLTAEQQGKLLKLVLPTALKNLIKSTLGSA